MDNKKREIDPAVKSKVTAFLANQKANKSTLKKVKYQETVNNNNPQNSHNQNILPINNTPQNSNDINTLPINNNPQNSDDINTLAITESHKPDHLKPSRQLSDIRDKIKSDINQDKSDIEKTLKPDELKVSDINQQLPDMALTMGKNNEVIAVDNDGQWTMDDVKEVKTWLEILYNPQKKYDIEEGMTYIKNMIPPAVFNKVMKLFTASPQSLPKPTPHNSKDKLKAIGIGNNSEASNNLTSSDESEGINEAVIDSQGDKIIIDDSYQLIENDKELIKACDRLHHEKVLGIDTETTGLDPHIDKLRLIQIASNNHPTIIIDCYKCNPKLIQPLLINESIKVFHNAKFDLKFFLAVGLEINQILFDTMLAYQLINSGKSNLKASLKEVTKEYLDIELNKDEQVSQWANKELTESQLKYSAIDAKILLPLREKLKEEIVTANLIRVTKIEFDCVLAVAMMEFNGMLLDLAQWQNILEDTQKRKDELEIELKQLLSLTNNKLDNNSSNKSEQLTLVSNEFDFSTEINLDSPKQVLEALNKIGIPCQNTNSKTLKKLLTDYPILKPFLEYKKLTKILSSFGDSLTKQINPVTGRLHGSYNQLRAKTGRFTSSDPNLQNLPRNKETRSCYIASPNHKLIIADYSQIELRIASEVANDKTMIEAYNRGEDLHKLTASIVLNKPLDEISKGDRQIAKSANFGLIYGSSVNGFRGYAESNYGISLSEKEAKTIMDNFFNSYQGLAKWHQITKNKIYTQGINETRTLGNRRRLFDNATPQQILNTPIQGTGADILKLALANLVKALKPYGDKVKLLATVHDEIILEAHKDIANEIAVILSEVMVNSGKEFLKRVPIEADSSIGNNWSDK